MEICLKITLTMGDSSAKPVVIDILSPVASPGTIQSRIEQLIDAILVPPADPAAKLVITHGEPKPN